MSKVSLRPHHLICLRMFTGHGYDDDFVDNMYDILDRLQERKVVVEIASGCDDVCSACPHKLGEVCEFRDSVAAKDASVLSFLGLDPWSSMTSKEMEALVDEKLADLGDINAVCGECEWSEMCNKQLRE